jgi:hypothetical protein
MANDIQSFDSATNQNPFMFEEQPSEQSPVQSSVQSTGQSTAPANPFMFEGPQPAKQEETSSFMAGVDAFNRQFGRMAEGILDLVTTGSANKAIRNVHNTEEANYARSYEQHPVASTIGAVAGGIGSGVAYGSAATGSLPATLIGKAATFAASHPYLAASAAGGLGSAAMGYLDYAPDQASRLAKSAVAGTVGAIAAPVVLAATRNVPGMLQKAGTAIDRFRHPNEAALNDLTATIKADLGDNASAKIKESLQPAIDMGTTRTPGQVVGGLTRANETNQAADVASQLRARTVDRIQSEQTLKGVNDVIERIAPAGTKELKTQLYAEMAPLKVGDDVVAQLRSNPEIATQLDNLTSGTRVPSAIKGLPDNSVTKLDIVHKQIGELLYKDAHALDKSTSMSQVARDALQEARHQITGTLDPIVQQYAPARQAAQKLIMQKRYGELLLKKGANLGQNNELGIDGTWKALFPTKEAQQVFINDVIDAGGSEKQATNVITMMDQLRGNTLKRIWSRPVESNASTVFYGNKIGFVQKMIDKLTGHKYRNAVLNLAFDGNKWADQVEAVLNQPVSAAAVESTVKLMLKAAVNRSVIPAGALGVSRGLLDQK